MPLDVRLTKMCPNDEPENPKVIDARTFRKVDRFAYAGIGVYSAINLAWIIWALTVARFGIFDTEILIGIVVPVIGLLALIVFQCSARHNRFSPLANILSILTVIGWFFSVWYIIEAAYAAV